MQEIIKGTLIEEDTLTFSINEICKHCSISKELIVQMIDYGVIDFNYSLKDSGQIEYKALKRIEAAVRLSRDLEINIPGIALILELKEEIEQLRTELNILQSHLSR